MNIPAELEAAIEACYRTFNKCTLPSTLLDVCTHCCMDEKLEAEMHRLPLRQIGRRHMYAYNDSAKSEVQPTPELRYLIPRLLELVARGEPVHHSTELYLDRLGRRKADAFSLQEWASIERACQGIFTHRLTLYPWQRAEGRSLPSLFDLLLMFAMGGVDIAPMLARWHGADTPQGTLNYVASSYWDYWCHGGGAVRNAFGEDRGDFQTLMCAWLESAETKATFAQRILALDLDALPGFNSWNCGCRFTPRQLVENTFDAVAS
ncbi:hypothetical protein [Ottowia oryzae]|nr:hypothetical protein [Ottowia oryzae]